MPSYFWHYIHMSKLKTFEEKSQGYTKKMNDHICLLIGKNTRPNLTKQSEKSEKSEARKATETTKGQHHEQYGACDGPSV